MEGEIRIATSRRIHAALRLDRVLVLAWPPVTCACGRMAAFLVNRDGKTRCVDCDKKHECSKQEEKGPA